jgi:twitching motility protein PilI
MATKVSLRQFQQDLAQRLSSAKTEPVSAARLGVQCGASFWLIALEDAGEIVPVPELLPVPLSKPWYLGLANIRGSLYSVVDFSAFAGGEPTARSADSRLVLAGPRFGINSALLVSRMLGLRNARDLQPVADEPQPTAVAAWSGRAWRESAAGGAAAGRVWRELKFEHLIESADFLNVGL